jgi:dienelactone hydrolase
MRSELRWAARSIRRVLWLGLALLGISLGSCQQRVATPPGAPAPTVAVKDLPALGPSRKLENGVLLREASWGAGLTARKVWVYLPEKPPADAKLPCVLIAPAGSTLLTGMGLADGDRAEHLPYVRAGFAVVAYSIDGPSAGDRDEDVIQALPVFFAADAGVVNARQALDYALHNVDMIDPAHVYTAGHSSAATLSLLVAANEPRVKACVAYAPATDVEQRFPAQALRQLDRAVPGTKDNVAKWSPKNQVTKLTCPVFLFHAEDDTNVPIGQTAAFAETLKKTNPKVTFVRAKRGNHHDSMIKEGIPQAIKWLQEQGKK